MKRWFKIQYMLFIRWCSNTESSLDDDEQQLLKLINNLLSVKDTTVIGTMGTYYVANETLSYFMIIGNSYVNVTNSKLSFQQQCTGTFHSIVTNKLDEHIKQYVKDISSKIFTKKFSMISVANSRIEHIAKRQEQ